MNLKISSERDGDTLTMTVEGELTRDSIDSFKSAATTGLTPGDQLAVVCRDLSYVDSAGLGAFIFVRKAVLDQGGRFYLTSVGGWLQKFLEMTGLEQTLTAANRDATS